MNNNDWRQRLYVMVFQADTAAGRLVQVPVVGADLTRRLRAVWPDGQRPGGPALDLLRIAGHRPG